MNNLGIPSSVTEQPILPPTYVVAKLVPQRWEVAEAQQYSPAYERLLANNWEPFTLAGDFMWFKRPMTDDD